MIKKLMVVILGAAAAWSAGWKAEASEAADSVGLYCVLDLSAGTGATSYPVTYLDAVPSDGWTDEHKTDKIVLRRIEGTRGAYYAGVFEVTEAQWDKVMGGSSTSTKPKGSVSYNTIRGNSGTYDWPNSNAVAPTSFMGRLRQKTGLSTLDLPSEDEWVYAARAGVTTTWLCGDSETGLDDYAWYSANSDGGTHPVGTRRANAWGLYDVHGNVWEWCLDRYSSDYGLRVLRGGSYDNFASLCAFAFRGNNYPFRGNSCDGFRLFLRSTDRRAGLRWQTIADGSEVSGGIPVGYAPCGTTNAVVTLDGKPLVQSDVAGSFVWQPQTPGKHTLAHTVGADTLTATYDVVELDFWAQPAPNPPMAEDAAIAITPVTREIPQAGGGAAIVTSGSGTWTAAVSDGWISLSAASGAAGKPVAYVVGANADVEERVGYVYVAGHVHTVRQKGLGATVDRTSVTVERDGGTGTVTVHPADTRSSWRARPNCDWISVSPTSGTGPAEVTYRVAPWHEVSARSGTITVGDKVIYVTQRAYDLDISPKGDWVTGNAGAGEIGVSASVGDVWSAIVTEPWISIVTGYDAGTGSGTVRFTYTDNDTGKTRTGKIIVAGEVYTLTQAARVLVAVAADVEGGGHVSGAGSYTLGEKATLEAVPEDGYEFLYWTGDAGETMENPLVVTADVAKRVTAHFAPLTPEFTSAESSTDGVTLRWRSLAWATEYRIYRAPTSEFPSKEFATLAADGSCVYLDATGEAGTTYFYWVQAVGASDTTESKDAAAGAKVKPVVRSPVAYENLRGASHANPATYAEGTALAFSAPGAVTGYTFTGWTPASITAEMTGAQTVRANWRANAYRIVYMAGGGAGATEPTDCAYDAEATVAESAFVREGYVFRGWATEEGGEVVYAPGATIRNLTTNDGGVVTLYAVWEAEAVDVPVISPADGTVFRTASCTVTVTCGTKGATVYYSTNGRTPRPTEANRYTGPFEVTGTTTVLAYAVKGERASGFAEATLVYVEPEPLTLENALDERKLAGIATGGDATWAPVEDAAAKAGESAVRSGAVGMEQSGWLEATVHGRGTLSFWWKTSCEPDPRGRYTYDHVTFAADGEDRAKLDGETDWQQVSVTFETDGAHTLRWTYSTDDWEEPGYQDCAWVDGVSWTGAAAPTLPGVVGDGGATVTGDAASGFVVTPSAGLETVEVTVPDGLDAAKVTVEVPPTAKTVKPHGATVKVVRDGHDITDFLDIPEADASGAVDLASATVKADVAREPLDPDKGAVVDLGDASAPSIKTAPTRPGLVYTLREGATLDAMADGDSTVGDGKAWMPKVTVKGGVSGFYSIRVSK